MVLAMFEFSALRVDYADNWRAMTLLPNRRPIFDSVAARLYQNIDRYRAVERLTGVPAAVVAVIHEREASGSFSAYLGNGEPWNQKTASVPRGRGPFSSFEAGAVDALHLDGLDKVTDWSVERALHSFEKFNGFGYRMKGVRSPYLWGGTSLQQPGKYVRDGVFDPTVMDKQLGCAGILAALWILDPALRFPVATPVPPEIPVPLPVPRPQPAPAPPITPAQGAIGAGIVAVLAGIATFWQQIVAWFQHLFGG
jgi:lysozyme family protein